MHFFQGVNLLIGTENGLMLLDRSGQGKGWSKIDLIWTSLVNKMHFLKKMINFVNVRSSLVY